MMLGVSTKCRPSVKVALFLICFCCIVIVWQMKRDDLQKTKNLALQKIDDLLKRNSLQRRRHGIVQKIQQPLYSVKFSDEMQSKRMNNIRVKEINCAKLFQKDVKEQEKALEMTSYRGPTLPLERFSDINCKNFIQERGYITSSLTSEEKNFPIAYSIVVYKDLGQVERLFRAIYRPQNVYCFHADKKSPKEFHEGLRRLVKCFPNVIMSSRSVDVIWGKWTNIECDLICMDDLLNRFPKWKYLINLTGQEFPLRTNLELVRILKALNGSNSIEGTVIEKYRIPTKNASFPVKWIKGSVHIMAIRRFFEFLFHNEKAIEIADLLKDRDNPDETLFSTVNHNPQLKAPGGYLFDPMTKGRVPLVARLKNWEFDPMPCESGFHVRDLCIWGIKDLPLIDAHPAPFINKLYWNFQPFTYDCLEERIFNNTRKKKPLNLDFFRKLDTVKSHQ